MVVTTLQQRFYPTLRVGLEAKVVRKGREISLHCRQGKWDGACGLHCSVMALALLGKISNITDLANRRYGVAARLWKASQSTYFEGLDNHDLASMLQSLEADLSVTHCAGTHRKVLGFTQQRLDKGDLIIIGWRTESWSIHHWVLCHGVEGMQSDKKFIATTFLVLDPSGNPPQFCGYNGRLQLKSGTRSGKPSQMTYSDNNGYVRTVSLTSAVAINNIGDSLY